MGLLPVLLVILVLLPGQSNFSIIDSGVSANATAFSSQRKVVRDRAGDLFAIYLKPVQDFSQVFLSRSADNGESWRVLGQVSGGDYQSVRASIAIDEKNAIYVFWTKFIEAYGQIFYRVYADGVWSDEHQLTSGDAYSGYPSVCVDSKGHLHLVWYGFDGIAYQVFYTKFNGSQWTSPIKLSQGYPDSVNPTVAVDSSDNVHVAWFKSNGRWYQINYIKWSGSWGTQTILSSSSADAFNPTMAVDSNGRVFVAWDEGSGPITQIYYSVYSGSEWSRESSLSTGPSAQNPSIAIDAQDNVYLLYDKSDGQIYMRRYDGAWEPELKVTSSGTNSYPSVRWSFLNNPFSGPGGKVDFVWTSKDDGVLSVKYGALNIPTAPTTTQTGAQPPFGGTLLTISLLVGLGVIAAVVAYTYVRRRRDNAG